MGYHYELTLKVSPWFDSEEDEARTLAPFLDWLPMKRLGESVYSHWCKYPPLSMREIQDRLTACHFEDHVYVVAILDHDGDRVETLSFYPGRTGHPDQEQTASSSLEDYPWPW